MNLKYYFELKNKHKYFKNNIRVKNIFSLVFETNQYN